MFNPLGALGSAGRGYLDYKEKDEPALMNQIGMQALGKALFQPPPQQPMAPPPGQASMPSQPPPQAPLQQAAQPMPPEMQNTPMAQQTNPMTAGLLGGGPPQQQQGQGAAPGGQQPVAMPPQQMGGGAGQGMDLQGLIGRIRNANPGIPPQAMMAALNHAMPILNLQARDQLLQMRRQMYGLNAPLRNRAMDLRQQELDMRAGKLGAKGGGGGGPPPEAMSALQEGHVTTFANGQQWTLQNGAPVQIDDGGGGMGEGGGMGGGDSGNYNPTQRMQSAPTEARRYRGPEIPMEEFQRQSVERLRQQYPDNVPWSEIDRLNLAPEGGALPLPAEKQERPRPNDRGA